MKLKFKLSGALMLGVVALGIMGASFAQAGEFKAGANPAQITGQQVGKHKLKTILGTIECEVGFQGELAGSSEDLTLTPSYGNKCEIGGTQVDVVNNGCDFRFHAGATLGGNAVEGSMDVKCPAGAAMDFGITYNPTCHLRIGEQVGLNEVTYTNRPMAKDVDFDFGIENLVYAFEKECPVEANTYEGGSYTGTSTVKAEAGGVGVGFAVE